jgi:Mycobacterium membrane protein
MPRSLAAARRPVVNVVLVLVLFALASAPIANGQDSVTYEVVSADVTTANVEYFDTAGRHSLEQVSLPWRISVTVAEARKATKDGAEIRADWRPQRARFKWVAVRIYLGQDVLCQSTLDVGDATCYGSTPHLA